MGNLFCVVVARGGTGVDQGQVVGINRTSGGVIGDDFLLKNPPERFPTITQQVFLDL